eukprot:6912584-Prymnesium_polylepis.1
MPAAQTSTLKPEKLVEPAATSGGWKAGEPRDLDVVSPSSYRLSSSATCRPCMRARARLRTRARTANGNGDCARAGAVSLVGGGGVLARAAAHAKVGDLEEAVGGDHDVGGLDVAVDDALRVAVLEADKQLAQQEGCDARRQHRAGRLVCHVLQVAAGHLRRARAKGARCEDGVRNGVCVCRRVAPVRRARMRGQPRDRASKRGHAHDPARERGRGARDGVAPHVLQNGVELLLLADDKLLDELNDVGVLEPAVDAQLAPHALLRVAVAVAHLPQLSQVDNLDRDAPQRVRVDRLLHLVTRHARATGRAERRTRGRGCSGDADPSSTRGARAAAARLTLPCCPSPSTSPIMYCRIIL